MASAAVDDPSQDIDPSLQYQYAGNALESQLASRTMSAREATEAIAKSVNDVNQQLVRAGAMTPEKAAELKKTWDEAVAKVSASETKTGKTADRTPVFEPDGQIDADKVTRNLTQQDEDATTLDDARRCGGTAAVQAAIQNGGKEGLRRLAEKALENDPENPDLKNAVERIKNGTATYADLGHVSSSIYNMNSRSDGMHGEDVGRVLKEAGITPPSGNPDKFKPGQSWPIITDSTRDAQNTPDHWMTVGKDKDGKMYIKMYTYDPWAKEGSQKCVEGTLI